MKKKEGQNEEIRRGKGKRQLRAERKWTGLKEERKKDQQKDRQKHKHK